MDSSGAERKRDPDSKDTDDELRGPRTETDRKRMRADSAWTTSIANRRWVFGRMTPRRNVLGNERGMY